MSGMASTDWRQYMPANAREGLVDQLLNEAAEPIWDARMDCVYAQAHLLGVDEVTDGQVRMALHHYVGVWNRLHLTAASLVRADQALRVLRDAPGVKRARRAVAA